MFSQIPLAWLQLIRAKTRFAIAIAGIAFANVLIFMQLGFQSALYDSNTMIHRSLQGDLFLISPQSLTIAYMDNFRRHRLYQARGFPEVASVSSKYLDFGRFRNPETGRYRTLLVIGYDPDKPTMKLRQASSPVSKLKIPDTAFLDRASRPEFGTAAISARPQSTLSDINGHRIEVNGVFTLGNSFAADGNLVVSATTFFRIFERKGRTPEDIEIGMIRLKPGADPAKAHARLKASLPKDVLVLTKQGFIDFEQRHWSSSTPIGFIFNIGVVMGFIVGAVIVYQILYTDVSDHLTEYATLKAMGYSDLYLFLVVLQEAFILSIFGYVVAFTLSVGLFDVTRSATFLPIAMNVPRAVIVLSLSWSMCFVAGFMALLKLGAADPADIF